MISAALAAGAALPLMLVLAAAMPAPEDFSWDALMAAGFLAAGGISLLPVVTARRAVRLQRSASVARAGFELHELLSYLFVGGVLVHAVGLIVYQPVIIEYMKLSAPGYMLAGTASAVMLLLIVALSKRPRRRFSRYNAWRRTHAMLSLSAIVLMTYHVTGSGYYLVPSIWAWLLTAIVAAPTCLSVIGRRGVAAAEKGIAPAFNTGASSGHLNVWPLLVAIAGFLLALGLVFASLRV